MIETRNYYISRDYVGRHVMNTIVDRIPCAISDIQVNREFGIIRFTVTCEPKNFTAIEKILKAYDMIGE